MQTKLLDVTTENIKLAARILQEGGLVAFPTETVYGLGANALDAEAVGKVYAAKGRPSDNPMIVHIAEADEIEKLTSEVTPAMKVLMAAFWPGPLTMVVNKLRVIPDVTTGGLDTVGVRMPSNKTARKLISLSGYPIAAPSANASGRPSPTKASHVVEDLDGRIDAILMGEDCQVGIESTVVDVTGDDIVILRPGVITQKELQTALISTSKKVEIDPALFANRIRDIFEGSSQGIPQGISEGVSEGVSQGIPQGISEEAPQGAELLEGKQKEFKPKAPGMKYKHYAPKAEMIIISGEQSKVKSEIEKIKLENESKGKKVGIILFEEADFKLAAHDFFAKLRELDGQAVELILAGAMDDADEVGFAVMNRMLKSAEYNVIKV